METSLQVLESAHNVLDSLQAPFAYVPWLIEQTQERLQDRLANEGRER